MSRQAHKHFELNICEVCQHIMRYHAAVPDIYLNGEGLPPVYLIEHPHDATFIYGSLEITLDVWCHYMDDYMNWV